MTVTVTVVSGCDPTPSPLLPILRGSGSLWAPTATQTAEAYDYTANKWSAMPKMVVTRAGALAIELRACGILVMGGGTGSSATSTNTTELLLR